MRGRPRPEGIAAREGFYPVAEIAVGPGGHELDPPDPLPDDVREAQVGERVGARARERYCVEVAGASTLFGGKRLCHGVPQ
jgi:hypothetical protein